MQLCCNYPLFRADPKLLQLGSEVSVPLVLGVELGDETLRRLVPSLKTIQFFNQFGIVSRIRVSLLYFVAHNLINARPDEPDNPIDLPVSV